MLCCIFSSKSFTCSRRCTIVTSRVSLNYKQQKTKYKLWKPVFVQMHWPWFLTWANSELYSFSVSRSCLFSISKSWAVMSFCWHWMACSNRGTGSNAAHVYIGRDTILKLKSHVSHTYNQLISANKLHRRSSLNHDKYWGENFQLTIVTNNYNSRSKLVIVIYM